MFCFSIQVELSEKFQEVEQSRPVPGLRNGAREENLPGPFLYQLLGDKTAVLCSLDAEGLLICKMKKKNVILIFELIELKIKHQLCLKWIALLAIYLPVGILASRLLAFCMSLIWMSILTTAYKMERKTLYRMTCYA